MTEVLFHIFNTTTVIGCLLFGWGVFFHGRRFGSDVLLLRRFVAVVFTCFALFLNSFFTILLSDGIEVFASRPLGFLSISFIISRYGCS